MKLTSMIDPEPTPMCHEDMAIPIGIEEIANTSVEVATKRSRIKKIELLSTCLNRVALAWRPDCKLSVNGS